MMLIKWDDLPIEIRTEEARYYYDILSRKTSSLFFKRTFDLIVSSIMLIVLSPVFLILAIAIKVDSEGTVFYRQVRVTQYGKKFRIFKFRTMIQNADKMGSEVTANHDVRVTRVGSFIRKYRLDELGQLIDVFRGTMTFVGTRPEVSKYVEQYAPKMWATLLLPAGITSEGSIYYKDEGELLADSTDIDKTYIEDILPNKMFYNLEEIEKLNMWHDIKIMVMTVLTILGKEYGKRMPDTLKEKGIEKR